MSNLSDKTITPLSESAGSAINVDFVPLEFRKLIETQGYNIIYEKALMCPCKTKGSDHRLTCRNCGGSGNIFVNPTSTKAIITSVNAKREYLDTGEIDSGQIYCTPVSLIKMADMDRITIIDGVTAHTEVKLPFIDENTGNYTLITHYNIEAIEWVGLYEGDDLQIKSLELNEDFTYSNNAIMLDGEFNSLTDPQISVRYTHFPQFFVRSIVNEIRSVKTSEIAGRQNNFMPMKAVCQRAHFLLDSENLEGNRLFDNSWEDMSCTKEEITKQEQILRYASANDIYETLTPIQRVQLKAIFDGRMPDVTNLTLDVPQPTVTVA